MEQKRRKLGDNLTQIEGKRRKLSQTSRMEEKRNSEVILAQSATMGNKLLENPRLPAELELQILAAALIPAQPCVPRYFEQCHDIWSLPHKLLNHDLNKPLIMPPMNLLSVSTTWREEGLKYFFANNTFIFNTNPYDLDELPRPQFDGEEIWQELRDPHATRLLDFIDRPDWKDAGSKLWNHNFSYLQPHTSHIDRHRHSIRKLALIYQPEKGRATTSPEFSDWDWILKLDWKSLPDLEILYLDLKGMEAVKPWGHANGRVLRSIMECVDQMKCLSLKKLILMNLVAAEAEKEDWRNLWRDALGLGGEIEVYIDESRIW